MLQGVCLTIFLLKVRTELEGNVGLLFMNPEMLPLSCLAVILKCISSYPKINLNVELIRVLLVLPSQMHPFCI